MNNESNTCENGIQQKCPESLIFKPKACARHNFHEKRTEIMKSQMHNNSFKNVIHSSQRQTYMLEERIIFIWTPNKTK